jgi:uncharacterized tellurite resistance protein B-like protein
VGTSGIKNLAIGAILLLASFLWDDAIAATISDFGFYLVVGVGAVIFVRGLFGMADKQSAEDIAEESAERPMAHEVLLNVLARGSYADSNIQSIEVETILDIYTGVTGEDVSTAEVRIAARADLYESEPFDQYLASVEGELSKEEKAIILKALCDVIRCDQNVDPFEVDFYNEVAEALNVAPAALSSLNET